MAKLVDVECPRCGVQTSAWTGLRDVDTGEILDMNCPKCGLDFQFGTQPPVPQPAKTD